MNKAKPFKCDGMCHEVSTIGKKWTNTEDAIIQINERLDDFGFTIKKNEYLDLSSSGILARDGYNSIYSCSLPFIKNDFVMEIEYSYNEFHKHYQYTFLLRSICTESFQETAKWILHYAMKVSLDFANKGNMEDLIKDILHGFETKYSHMNLYYKDKDKK